MDQSWGPQWTPPGQPWQPPPQQWQPPGQAWPPPGQPWGRPTGPSVGWAVLLWCVAALSVVGALLFGVFAVMGFWVDNNLDDTGVTTSATVVDVSDNTVTVRFSTEDNRRITTEFTWMPYDFPAVDDEIDITYDPENPFYVIPAGSNEDQLLATIFAVIAAGALAVAIGASIGAVLVHRARGKAERASGHY